MRWMVLSCCVLFLCFAVPLCAAAPLNQNASKPLGQVNEERQGKKGSHGGNKVFDADPEYVRYIEELMKDMNDNPALREQFAKASEEDIKKGVIGDKLSQLSDQVRSQSEEEKRKTIEQLRVLQKLKQIKETTFQTKDVEILKLEKEHGIQLPRHFTDEDVEKLMKEQKHHLDELDSKRHEDFKHHEMQLAHKRKEKLKQMDEKARLVAEEKHHKDMEEAKHHEKLHHPGSKEQMEEVWEAEDGLDKEQFEPKTFFSMHDTNGDSMLDPLELEAMFLTEVQKIYNNGGEDTDQVEQYEEMARMREHVLKEMDRNQDGLLSINEFLGYTEEDEWKNDSDGWEGIVDENEQYTEDEFKQWEDDYYGEDYLDHLDDTPEHPDEGGDHPVDTPEGGQDHGDQGAPHGPQGEDQKPLDHQPSDVGEQIHKVEEVQATEKAIVTSDEPDQKSENL